MGLKEFFEDQVRDEMESFKSKIGEMRLEKKMRLCYKWHYQGASKKFLADFFGVTVRTVYSWLKEENKHLLDEFEVKSGLDLLIEQFADLEQYEKVCMLEASCIGADQLEIDPETGEKRLKAPTAKGLENKARFLELARKFREMQIDLLTQTGLIPKQPDKIYNTVKDNKVELESDDLHPTADKLNKVDLSKTVIEKLMNQTNL